MPPLPRHGGVSASAPQFGNAFGTLAVLLFAPTLYSAACRRTSAAAAARRCSCSCCSRRRSRWRHKRRVGGGAYTLDGAALPVWSRGFALCAARGAAGRAARAARHRPRAGGAPCATATSFTCRRATCTSLWPARSRRSTRRRASSSSAAVRTSACRSSCGAARGGWWAPSRQSPGDASLRAFLCDTRLAAWFVQNYDLAGRDAAALPPVRAQGEAAADWRRPPFRATAIAVGRRARRRSAWHSCAPPRRGRRADRVLAAFTANQFGGRRQLRAALAALPPSTVLRPPVVSSPSGSTRRSLRGRRGARQRHRVRRGAAGRGRDAPRLVIAPRRRAVVLRSTLDELYAGFPVVVVDSWAELNASALRGWRARRRRPVHAGRRAEADAAVLVRANPRAARTRIQ